MMRYSPLMPLPIRGPRFKCVLKKELTLFQPSPVTGFVWEAVMYRTLKVVYPTRPTLWNPSSIQSGVDILHDGVGYSLKSTKFATPNNKKTTLNSYRLNRCKSDKDAIAEIDRPHRHNYEWYSILARRVEEPADTPNVYSLYVFPSCLTLASRFEWDYHEGKLMTNTRDGVSMEISGFTNRSNKKSVAKNKQLWIKIDFEHHEDLLQDQGQDDGGSSQCPNLLKDNLRQS